MSFHTTSFSLDGTRFFAKVIAHKPLLGSSGLSTEMLPRFIQFRRCINRFHATLNACELRKIRLQNRCFTWSNGNLEQVGQCFLELRLRRPFQRPHSSCPLLILIEALLVFISSSKCFKEAVQFQFCDLLD